ncbi:PP0621 family protein [Duganella radicis]|uniref:Deaminase n=1 Tax=Duganella radicis TaxID=551988 RepID=A0A6L6PLV6_9BURK|nr:PP0621 family protein [Duganella radicis]MTV40100.1 hypothetical protein [Duganella radicis]
MSRIIFWLALVFLVIFAVRSKIRAAQKRHQQQFRQPPQAQQPQPAPQPGQTYKARAAAQAANDAEVMLQCAHCGVFYPASETVQANGRDYCSAAHAALPSA